MDGIDLSMLRTDGVDLLEFVPSGFVPYDEDLRTLLRAEMAAQASGAPDPDATARASDAVVAAHREAIQAFGGAPELIGFHGQTVFHDPLNQHTVQLGDGSRLSDLPTVWDFRTADLKSGGEGAPLAPFYHFALARHAGLKKPVAFLNLGGVGNVTWIDPRKSAPEQDGALLAFDTGPANALVDDLVRQRADIPFDEGGALAASGRVDETVLSKALAHPYFERRPPKSLDRDTFADVMDDVSRLSLEDGCATLTAFSAQAVQLAQRWFPEPVETIFACGGGRHNATLMKDIAQGTNSAVRKVEDIGLDGDMLEAQAFAYLAVRVARGLATSAPSTTGCRIPVSGGRISGCFRSCGA